jgi:hypothetical protein
MVLVVWGRKAERIQAMTMMFSMAMSMSLRRLSSIPAFQEAGSWSSFCFAGTFLVVQVYWMPEN